MQRLWPVGVLERSPFFIKHRLWPSGVLKLTSIRVHVLKLEVIEAPTEAPTEAPMKEAPNETASGQAEEAPMKAPMKEEETEAPMKEEETEAPMKEEEETEAPMNEHAEMKRYWDIWAHRYDPKPRLDTPGKRREARAEQELRDRRLVYNLR